MIKFLNQDLARNKKIHILGAGSNPLFRDTGFDGIIIKLGKDFSYTKKLNDNKSINLKGVLITHHHYDHTNGLDDLLKKYNLVIN